MIVEINGKRKRKLHFQTHKVIGKDQYELHYHKRGQTPGTMPVKICLNRGGKLAMSIGTHFGSGEKIKRYEISFRRLPDKVKEQVKEAIDYIEKNGTPMENDESIFSY
jgi:hypothetical protein